MNKFAIFAFTAFLAFATSTFLAQARPVYARQEGKACGYCHIRPQGGGARGFRGMYYGANGLSFEKFDEKREAKIAGVSPDSEGVNMAPSVSYSGNVSGAAVQQIQVASLRGPVMLLFVEKADEPSKAAVKALAALARQYGERATILGVAKGPDPLKLTSELGDQIRIYSDLDGTAMKKFSLAKGLDMATVAKLGDPIKSFSGFSAANLEAAIKSIGIEVKR